ncbi:hypothetical protein MKW92_009586, partial [Papaver armeniacum]
MGLLIQDINLENDALALMSHIDLRKSYASGHSMVVSCCMFSSRSMIAPKFAAIVLPKKVISWRGARSTKMVEDLNYMNK